MKHTVKVCVTFVILSILSQTVAEGAITYDLFFRLSGNRDGMDSVFTVGAGEIIGASVILRETVTGADAAPLATDNLSGFGFNLFATGSNGLFRGLAVDGSGGNIQADTDNDTAKYFALSPVFGQPGKPGVVVGSGVREIVLAAVEFVAPTVGSTTFLVQDQNPTVDGDFGTFSTPSFERVARESVGGEFLNRSMTLNVTAIPEPATVLGLSLLSGCVLLRRRRRL